MNLPLALTRRQALFVGAGAFGLSLPQLMAATDRGRARARSVIILYLSGGPSQLDMWDMKPLASEEVRGTFRPVGTSVPGTHICEHMPRMARLAHLYTIVRSMSHNESDHLRAGYWVMTGGRLTRPITAFSNMQRDDRPHLGAIVSRERPQQRIPPFVVLPEYVSPRGIPRPGQHGGFLGPRFDPYAIDSDPNLPTYSAGPIAEASFGSADRVETRVQLLRQIEQRSPMTRMAAAGDFAALRNSALDLVTAGTTRVAYDISRESSQTRDRYGRHIFGQSVLVARRLIEAGVRLVQVNFVRRDNGRGGQGYDSHSVPPNPPHLSWAKQELLPPTDAAFAALIEDLEDRGLLDETLVVMMGEFGRTPRFNSNGGRDHWPGCYSLVLAGGGIARGRVHGESDSMASTPMRDPVSPNDLLATIYHLLGINHRNVIYDLQERPHPIVDGEPVLELLA